jgi:hypothetical protein
VQLHANAVFGPQRHGSERNDRITGIDGQAVFLRNRRQQQCCFHRGKRRTHANARAAAEGKIRKFRQLFFKLLGPALRQELFRLLEVPRVPLHRPLADEHVCAGGHAILAELNFAQCLAPDAPSRRKEAQ